VDDRAGRSIAGIVEERPERGHVRALPDDTQTAGGPGAHPGIRVGEEAAQQGKALGPWITRQGVGGADMDLGVRQGKPPLGQEDGRILLEEEEVREQPGPALLLVQREQGLGDVQHRRLELAQGLHGQGAGLAVRVGDRLEERRHGLRVVQLAEREGRGPAHGGHVVQEEPDERRPGLGVGNPAEGLGQGLPQLRSPGERLLDDHRLVHLAVHQKKKKRANLQVWYRSSRAGDPGPPGTPGSQ
jgi:hypothetical protein